MIPKQGRYLVGVSGGPDSMALLDMCHQAGLHVQTAHVNYRKRDTALRDEEIVRSYCLERGIPFHVLEADPDAVKGNFQAHARKVRYAFFADLCDKQQLDAVLVAHQQDDLIETYLMQREKKLGVDHYGLVADNTIEGVRVLRPLLEFDKKTLQQYCQENGIAYGIDESNLTDDYQRNRIRHSLIEKMDRKQRSEILAEIDRLNQAKIFQDKEAGDLLEAKELDAETFCRSNAWKAFLRRLFPGHSDRYYEEMFRQLKSLDRYVHQEGGQFLTREYGRIYHFTRPEPYAHVIEDRKDIRELQHPCFRIALNGDSLHGVTISDGDLPLTIRNTHEGDMIAMRFGTKKINRFFIDRKIPLKRRLGWPVVENAKGQIILVPGLGCDRAHYTEKPDMFVLEC